MRKFMKSLAGFAVSMTVAFVGASLIAAPFAVAAPTSPVVVVVWVLAAWHIGTEELKRRGLA